MRERDLPGYTREGQKIQTVHQINLKPGEDTREWLAVLNSKLAQLHESHSLKIVEEVKDMTARASEDPEESSPVRKRALHFRITRKIAYGALLVS